MRIAVIMASGGSRLGGLETIAREFARGLSLLGHDVTLVTGTGLSARLLPEVSRGEYRVVTAPMFGQNSTPAKLISRLRRVHPSVVEARTFWWAARLWSRARRALETSDVISAHFEPEAVAASREIGVPVVYYYAGAMHPPRLARGRFARMVAISGVVSDLHEALTVEGLPHIDGVVLPGVRREMIASGPATHVADTHPRVLFTGRLDNTAEKGVDSLLEWWPRIRERAPAASLTIAGGGTQLGAVRRRVAGMGPDAGVNLPGPLRRGDLLARLHEASVYVFPSHFETFGIAPLEALASGLPVVASDIAALRESLAGAALFLPPHDNEAWIETLVRLLSNPDERVALAARGPARARQLTWEDQSRLYEAHLLAASISSPSLRPSAPGERRRAWMV